MRIDSTGRSIEEVLRELRSVFSIRCTLDEGIDIMVGSKEDALKVKGYATMSGFDVEVKHLEGGHAVRITGTSCGCGGS